MDRRERVPSIQVGADPGAGAEVTFTVPAFELWELISLRFDLVTDATVANRFPQIVLDDGVTEFARIVMNGNQPASTTFRYTAYRGGQNVPAVANSVHAALPQDMVLLPGYRIRTVTTGIVAGDNYGTPIAYVLRP